MAGSQIVHRLEKKVLSDSSLVIQLKFKLYKIYLAWKMLPAANLIVEVCIVCSLSYRSDLNAQKQAVFFLSRSILKSIKLLLIRI